MEHMGGSLREGIKRIIIDWGDKEPFAHSTAISFSSGVAVPLQEAMKKRLELPKSNLIQSSGIETGERRISAINSISQIGSFLQAKANIKKCLKAPPIVIYHEAW